MSFRKASYLKNIAESVYSGELNIDELIHMSDEEVIKKLTSLNGIGVWTAEMLIVFSMLRPDIVSWGDLAIKRGLCKLYNHKELTKTHSSVIKKDTLHMAQWLRYIYGYYLPRRWNRN